MASSKFAPSHRLQVHGQLYILLLNIIIQLLLQISALDDVKTTNQNDNNAAKILGLDHLGVIAARLRSSALKFSPNSRTDLSQSSIDEVG